MPVSDSVIVVPTNGDRRVGLSLKFR